MEKLIGQLCMAANKAEIELTAAQLERLGKELERMMGVKPAPVPAEKPTDSKIESVDAPTKTPAPVTPAKVSKPKTVKEKASGNKLTPREQEMWDYVQAHPGSTAEEICKGMGVKDGNFRFLRQQLRNKGYKFPIKNVGRISKKAQLEFKAAENRDMNQRMEDAYMGEHPNIQPEPVQKKPVSEKAQRLYEYMKSHPDSRMPKTCEDLNITNGDYYMLKAQLKKNGWIESAVENVQTF